MATKLRITVVYEWKLSEGAFIAQMKQIGADDWQSISFEHIEEE
jgi:hypothetical protein